MHELSVCQAIVDTVRSRAGGRQVQAVQVRIGHLRQVVPDSLLFSWEVLTSGTELEGCTLGIEHVPAMVLCRRCAAAGELAQPLVLCPSCASDDVEVVHGEELQLAYIDVVEAVR